ncbi:MAG: patatin-like phospholipase family protein [Polyangiaceae bacterium]
MSPRPRLALVLTGGGARGAYQAGVLRGLADRMPRGAPSPFTIIAGASAGAINALALAAGSGDFRATTARLWETWANLDSRAVFRSDAGSIARIGAHWTKDLLLGGFLGTTNSNHLLDTSPLRALLAAELDFGAMRASIRSGRVHAVAISATNYASGAAVTFFEGGEGLEPWVRTARVGVRASLSLEHVMASAAIPVFFPPERLAGSHWGDGCVRLSAPLSPAIHLGADQVLAIGVRTTPTAHEARADALRPLPRVAAADLGGTLLNAVFLDSLEADLERAQRINRTLALLGPHAAHPDGLRIVRADAICPSRDLGPLAGAAFASLPRTLRYMLRGIGVTEGNGWALLSYLAFDPSYTRPLLEIGRADALASPWVDRVLDADRSAPRSLD